MCLFSGARLTTWNYILCVLHTTLDQIDLSNNVVGCMYADNMLLMGGKVTC